MSDGLVCALFSLAQSASTSSRLRGHCRCLRGQRVSFNSGSQGRRQHALWDSAHQEHLAGLPLEVADRLLQRRVAQIDGVCAVVGEGKRGGVVVRLGRCDGLRLGRTLLAARRRLLRRRGFNVDLERVRRLVRWQGGHDGGLRGSDDG